MSVTTVSTRPCQKLGVEEPPTRMAWATSRKFAVRTNEKPRICQRPAISMVGLPPPPSRLTAASRELPPCVWRKGCTFPCHGSSTYERGRVGFSRHRSVYVEERREARHRASHASMPENELTNRNRPDHESRAANRQLQDTLAPHQPGDQRGQARIRSKQISKDANIRYCPRCG